MIIFLLLLSISSSANDCALPTADKITVMDIKRLTSAPCDFDINRLVTSLPYQVRNTAVLMKKSASMAGRCTDPANPRIIYFAENFVLAVPWKSNSDSSCQFVETFGPLEGESLNPTFIQFGSNRVTDTSGARCVSCHTQNFQPIWQSYPNWKMEESEAFGFNDDLLDVHLLPGSPRVEEKALRTFLEQVNKEKKMNWFGNGLRGFLQGKKYYWNRQGNYYGRNNSRLGLVLNWMQAKKTALETENRLGKSALQRLMLDYYKKCEPVSYPEERNDKLLQFFVTQLQIPIQNFSPIRRKALADNRSFFWDGENSSITALERAILWRFQPDLMGSSLTFLQKLNSGILIQPYSCAEMKAELER